MSFLVYGCSLACCSAASTLLHGAHGTEPELAFYALLDHIGIYLLIAGTYTPIAWNLMEGKWRRGILAAAWLAAAAGSGLQLAWGTLPPALYTTLYLTMGWGAVLCYSELSRIVSQRDLIPLGLGGVFYSAGALINLFRWPNVWPGVFGFHELFHLLVVAASASHFWFMMVVVIPYSSNQTAGKPFRASLRPAQWVYRPAAAGRQAPHLLSSWRAIANDRALSLLYRRRWKRSPRS